LSERGRLQLFSLTTELASKPQADNALITLSAYATAPLTMRIGTPNITLADMMRQVLSNYPSIRTERLSELKERTCGPLPPREFSMEEFVAVETAELPLKTVADTVPLEPRKDLQDKTLVPVCESKRTRPQTRARLHLRPTGPVGPPPGFGELLLAMMRLAINRRK